MNGGVALAEEALALELATHLCRKYPGYSWGVDVEAGMVKVMNAELSGSRAYVVKIGGGYTWGPLAAAVTRGAGEVLERYGVSRERRIDSEMDDLVRDVRGDAVGEVT